MKKVDLFERFKQYLKDLSDEELERAQKILECLSGMESDTGALVVYLKQNAPLPPQDLGMLHSLNSRESGGFVKNLSKIFKGRNGEAFFQKFFLNYGDDSIADCATLHIFVDGLTMTAANQLQSSPLYNGQETSSRYVEMTSLGYYDPIGTDESKEVFSKLFAFYAKAIEEIKPSLRKRFPKADTDNDNQYENALHAKGCDILGAFLPAGARTNASISMNIRQLRDQYQVLKYNKATEVNSVANTILAILKQELPDSFDRKPKNEKEAAYFAEQETYLKLAADKTLYHKVRLGIAWPDFDIMYEPAIDAATTEEWARDLFIKRPKSGARLLPNLVGAIGTVTTKSLLDYRSMRDWHRHRNGLFFTPLLTTQFGFEPWYLENLTNELRSEAEELLKWLEERLETFSNVSAEDLQYFIPMGYRVAQKTIRNLSSEIFVCERRTSLRVHPTARRLAVRTTKYLQSVLPKWMTLHVDLSESEWTIKRGDDVITEKA